MGTWASGTFANDISEDWLDAFLEEPSRGRITETFEEFRESGADDADACCEALAAAEVVAALDGRPAEELPEELTAWLDQADFKPSKTMRTQAGAAVARILRSSELAELWGDDDAWEAGIEDLLRRLGREPKPKPKSKKQSFRVTGLYGRLKKMTNRAGLAFAVRCTMRVQPLFERCEAIPAGDRQWLAALVAKMEDFTAGRPVQPEDLKKDPYEKGGAWQRLLECRDAAAQGGNMAARCACDAVRQALSAAADVRRPTTGYVSDAPQQVAQSAKVAAEFVGLRTLKPLNSDFKYLEEHYPRAPGDDLCSGDPIDVSEKGPLGPLWGNSPPDWFVRPS
ncbi:hypothetical protein Mal4_20150 [Maioricimonas rarisocia]|uniref:DUF4259 domain-containing protein n=1 Tax=Maioricimonas rarisocia TaxID=2528026 RepID=A0A517Z5H5_9PLAN|nr:DUF4259 domain-containing protein [Maioricimonas rarisocia]QDU37699.1 hypothetical protein Mal4_20150 [Maioricimonas rarisocia]